MFISEIKQQSQQRLINFTAVLNLFYILAHLHGRHIIYTTLGPSSWSNGQTFWGRCSQVALQEFCYVIFGTVKRVNLSLLYLAKMYTNVSLCK